MSALEVNFDLFLSCTRVCPTSKIQARDHTCTVVRLSLDLNCIFVTVQLIFNRLLTLIQHELLDERVELCSVTEASRGFTIHPQQRSGRMRPACRICSTNSGKTFDITHAHFHFWNVHEVYETRMHIDSHWIPQSQAGFKTTSCVVLLCMCTMYMWHGCGVDLCTRACMYTHSATYMSLLSTQWWTLPSHIDTSCSGLVVSPIAWLFL